MIEKGHVKMMLGYYEEDARRQGVKASWCLWLLAFEDVGLQAFTFHNLVDVRFHNFVKPCIDRKACRYL